MTLSPEAAADIQVPDGKNKHETALWVAWIAGRRPWERDALVEFYSEWTRFMARRVFMRVRIPGVEWHDFVHYATIGLLEAIDRFEPERGLLFTTYARHRVRGAILNGLRLYRDQDHSGHGPGSDRLTDRADSLGAGKSSGDLLAEVIDISVGLALGHLLDTHSLSSGDEDDSTYAAVEHDLLLEDITKLVDDLPERENKVIRYHYYQHLPFVEVAELLGVTKGRVSQLHKQAVERIRKWLAAADDWNIVA